MSEEKSILVGKIEQLTSHFDLGKIRKLVGIAKEESFGVGSSNSTDITLLSIQDQPIKGKIKRPIKVDARFDCPCCGKGISIKVDGEI